MKYILGNSRYKYLLISNPGGKYCYCLRMTGSALKFLIPNIELY